MGSFLNNGTWVSEVPGSVPVKIEEDAPTGDLKVDLTKYAEFMRDVFHPGPPAPGIEDWAQGYDDGYRAAMDALLAKLEAY